jgi:hypothetical protein
MSKRIIVLLLLLPLLTGCTQWGHISPLWQPRQIPPRLEGSDIWEQAQEEQNMELRIEIPQEDIDTLLPTGKDLKDCAFEESLKYKLMKYLESKSCFETEIYSQIKQACLVTQTSRRTHQHGRLWLRIKWAVHIFRDKQELRDPLPLSKRIVTAWKIAGMIV